MSIIRLDDLLAECTASDEKVKELKFINIRGCNGSGKSTVVSEMKKHDESIEVRDTLNGKSTIVLTLFPNFRFVCIGSYSGDRLCGGCDTLSNFEPEYNGMNDFYEKFLEKIWNLDYNIIMEGVIISTINTAYADLFKKLSKKGTREVIPYFITTPADVCISRVLSRNNGKDVNEDYIRSKHKSTQKGIRIFKERNLHVVECDNSKYSIDDTLENFYKDVGLELPDYNKFVIEDDEW